MEPKWHVGVRCFSSPPYIKQPNDSLSRPQRNWVASVKSESEWIASRFPSLPFLLLQQVRPNGESEGQAQRRSSHHLWKEVSIKSQCQVFLTKVSSKGNKWYAGGGVICIFCEVCREVCRVSISSLRIRKGINSAQLSGGLSWVQ
jgi:hypothetical protein